MEPNAAQRKPAVPSDGAELEAAFSKAWGETATAIVSNLVRSWTSRCDTVIRNHCRQVWPVLRPFFAGFRRVLGVFCPILWTF